jgi:hypothetical protein
MSDMKTSGDRTGWIREIAATIMDGGPMPLSMLIEKVPPKLPTARNDGHVTAGQVLGEKYRNDYQAGWRIIIEEITSILASQRFVGIDRNGMVMWLKPLDGIWTVHAAGIDRVIWGQRERRLGRERNFLGERSEKDSKDIVTNGLGLVERDKAKALEVEIIGPRGKSEFKAFRVHPIALAIPPMTEQERESLREDIAQHGVKVPLQLYPDGDDPDKHGHPQIKVLDGRNRLYFASLLKKPVRVELFEGSEKEARDLVASLNLKRRHLSGPQRAIAIRNLYEKAAREKAAENRRETVGRPKKDGAKLPSNPKAVSEPEKAPETEKEWPAIAVKMAGGQEATGVTPVAVRTVAKIYELDAPKAQADLESGKTRIMAEGVKQAEEEHAERKGLPAPTQTYGQNFAQPDRTVFYRLGHARTELLAILADLNMPIGGKTPEDNFARIAELRGLLDKIETALKAQTP